MNITNVTKLFRNIVIVIKFFGNIVDVCLEILDIRGFQGIFNIFDNA